MIVSSKSNLSSEATQEWRNKRAIPQLALRCERCELLKPVGNGNAIPLGRKTPKSLPENRP
jgi:hypothetical protein